MVIVIPAVERLSHLMFARRDQSFTWIATIAYAIAVAFSALKHVMWRDEWIPITVARHTANFDSFFSEIRYLGRNGFFSFVWLLNEIGGLLLFKTALVAISIYGVYLFVRKSPFTTLQKALFCGGYYPLYEYGTILRDYGAILTLSIGIATLLASRQSKPLLMGLAIGLIAQTNAFGVMLGAVFGFVFLINLWKRGLLSSKLALSPGFIFGASVAFISLVYASAGFVQSPEITRAVMGRDLRTDSHFLRLLESAPFPVRAWFPIPLFGLWNSQLLDPWPILQTCIVLVVLAWIALTIRHSFLASITFWIGTAAMGAVLCHLPWTALRYHGPYFILLLMAWWFAEQDTPPDADSTDSLSQINGFIRGITSANARRLFLTTVLMVHAIVGVTFFVQERVVPFSGSQQAANIIRDKEAPDVLVVVDPDYAAISLAGCLERPVWIASRREFGAFTKVDKQRRGSPLSPDELGAVVSDRLAAENRDIVLVTIYPLSMPPELGIPIGVTKGITDENYFIYRIRYRSSSAN
jgi:hypothetical protein